MIIQRFDGGLSSRLAPQLLAGNQGAIYKNIDSSSGLLQPVKEPLDLGITVGLNDIYFAREDKWIKRTNPTSNVEFQNSLYMSDGVTEPTIYRRGEEFPMNMPTPKVTYAARSGAEYDKEDVSTGTYQYTCTYYDQDTGRESSADTPSAEFTCLFAEEVVNSRWVRLTFPTTRPYTIRVYRIGGMLTSWTLMREIKPTESAILDDRTPDSQNMGVLLHTLSIIHAPTGLTNLITAYGMLLGSFENKLRFTPIGKPGTWPEEYELNFESTITGLAAVATGILVFSSDKTYILLGSHPLQFTQQLLAGDTGCKGHDTIQSVVSGASIWQADDGLYTSSGAEAANLTYDKLGDLDLTPINGVVHKSAYYLLGSDGDILCWNYKNIHHVTTFSSTFKKLLVYKNKLCGLTAAGRLFELFTGLATTSLDYLSPLYTEGSYSTAKTYKKVYILSEGDIIISILIDGVEVASHDVTGKGLTQLQIPLQKQRGFGIQFRITGKGIVQELQCKAEGSDNVN